MSCWRFCYCGEEISPWRGSCGKPSCDAKLDRDNQTVAELRNILAEAIAKQKALQSQREGGR